MTRRATRACGLSFAIGLLLAPDLLMAVDPKPQPSAPTLEAVRRMSENVGPEKALAAQMGTWNAVATLWPAPNAAPQVTRGLIAERTMIGHYLQEVLQPAPGSKIPDFRRIDYLSFDHVEARWKYVSMDTRFPVSIMPAAGTVSSAVGNRVEVQFFPQAFVGFGKEVEGRFMMCDMIVTSPDRDHVVKEQRVSMADGSGRSWLFARYEYARR